MNFEFEPCLVIEDRNGLHYVLPEMEITDDNVWGKEPKFKMMDYVKVSTDPDKWAWQMGNGEIEDDAQVVAIYRQLRYRSVHPARMIASIKDVRSWTGLNRSQFATKYSIPYRTIQKWDLGDNTPKDWVLQALERCVIEDYILPELERDIAVQILYDNNGRARGFTRYQGSIKKNN